MQHGVSYTYFRQHTRRQIEIQTMRAITANEFSIISVFRIILVDCKNVFYESNILITFFFFVLSSLVVCVCVILNWGNNINFGSRDTAHFYLFIYFFQYGKTGEKDIAICASLQMWQYLANDLFWAAYVSVLC